MKKPVARVLVNTPAVYGSMGMTTNLFPAMTLGSGLTGFGITSDNVSPMNLIYVRKVGFGVRRVEDLNLGALAEAEHTTNETNNTTPASSQERLKYLQDLLEQALKRQQ